MKYLLVVGFACDVHKKEPRARIFFGDKLIDEFNIEHHKDTLTIAKTNFFQKINILQPYSTIELVNNVQIKNFIPLRFYEIKVDKTKSQEELRIEIKNNDSNYNNGFMTNSTLIQLQVCHFFPLDKKLLSRLVKIRNKNMISKSYAWFRSNKNTIFKLNENGIEWRGENTQVFNYKNNMDYGMYNIGGNGYFYCKLVKKYGIFISKLYKSYRYNLFRTYIIDYFINKYEQYENQRNSN
jgi:hypothetical protein